MAHVKVVMIMYMLEVFSTWTRLDDFGDGGGGGGRVIDVDGQGRCVLKQRWSKVDAQLVKVVTHHLSLDLK